MMTPKSTNVDGVIVYGAELELPGNASEYWEYMGKFDSTEDAIKYIVENLKTFREKFWHVRFYGLTLQDKRLL